MGMEQKEANEELFAGAKSAQQCWSKFASGRASLWLPVPYCTWVAKTEPEDAAEHTTASWATTVPWSAQGFLGTFTFPTIASIQLSPGRCTTGPKPPYLRRKAHFSHWWIKNTSLKPGANTLYQLCPVPTCGTHRIRLGIWGVGLGEPKRRGTQPQTPYKMVFKCFFDEKHSKTIV